MARKYEKPKYDPTKTIILTQLREAAGLTQDQAAASVGLQGNRRRESVSSWENGWERVDGDRRKEFIDYLWHTLNLRQDPILFQKVWDDLVVDEWNHPPLRDWELPEDFTQRYKRVRMRESGVPYHAFPSSTVPFLAPPSPPHRLVGRESITDKIKRRLLDGQPVALRGLPGVGKSALAVAVAHDAQILESFKDGILWVGLGHNPDVLQSLAALAKHLDVAAQAIANPSDEADWAVALHNAIGLRHMLIVVDDAWQVDAALAFRIGGPNCAHLLTSRVLEVASEFAPDGVVAVPELDVENSSKLLAQIAPKITELDPEIVAELVEEVGGLPLALLLIGKHLRREGLKGGKALLIALKQVRNVEKRIELSQPQILAAPHPSLTHGTPLSLAAVIEVSIAALSSDRVRGALYALSLFPPKPDSFSEEAALFVTSETTDVLEELINRGLLERYPDERLAVHQTIAAYSNLQLKKIQSYERMVNYFVEYLERHESDLVTIQPEVNNVLSALNLAAEHRFESAFIRGATLFSRFLRLRGLFGQAEALLRRAEQMARESGNVLALTNVLSSLGRVIGNRGGYIQAQEILDEALLLAQNAGDADKESEILLSLGTATAHAASLQDATEYYEKGLLLARKLGRKDRIAVFLQALGNLATEKGDLDGAQRYFDECLELQGDDVRDEDDISLRINLGVLAGNRGRYEQARIHFERGLEGAVRLKHFEMQNLLLRNLGEIALRQNNLQNAERLAREAVKLARENNHEPSLCGAEIFLGSVLLNEGLYENAEKHLKAGISVARMLPEPWYISQGLIELGKLYEEQEKLVLAYTQFEEAGRIAAEVGIAEFEAQAAEALESLQAAKRPPDNEEE